MIGRLVGLESSQPMSKLKLGRSSFTVNLNSGHVPRRVTASFTGSSSPSTRSSTVEASLPIQGLALRARAARFAGLFFLRKGAAASGFSSTSYKLVDP